MTTRKRNEFLDVGDSDEDDRGYDSEEESRAHIVKGSKRRKFDYDSEEDEDEGAFSCTPSISRNDENQDEFDSGVQHDVDRAKELRRLESLSANLPTTALDVPLKSRKIPLKPDKPKKDKSGVIYISRVPPFMKPTVLRSLLTPYGDIGRIFLTPESSTSRTSRLKSGGTRRKLFLDGWVEFLHKRDAKNVAAMLNAQIIGGKKRSKWHDEVWNIRYLKGVKWGHLVEQIQNENAERAARLRSDIAQSTRENKRFLEDIERGKMVAGIQEKRKKKLGEAMEEDEVVEKNVEVEEGGPRRTFKQREIRLKGEKTEDGQEVQRVLSKIF
ncbi:pre-rRNA-processing protein-like protein esf2 [Lojkania enalia]|uniref:18S rRNA factor 2 n=1 Tax=Lojkania enalia TaxID=147567 RepID=A0A9P4N3K0_9PLEO|nr:pre-rRNA-processing protein-like protein esf2 [Didymosphaeria enalia]